ncbi:hypothetical protein AC249_AIPGENE14514 [Exaiptasia diaphana]|nr:hypothetical protein AC249_AIPGENE14514 [Exaiptasia diaphana]
MLSKSKGQILRVAGVFTILFSLGSGHEYQPEHITDVAMTAAIKFVKLCGDHAFFLASRSSLEEEMSSVLAEAVQPAAAAVSNVPPAKDIRCHTLLLPGKRLQVTPLLKKKKWRGYGNKERVVKVLEELESLGLGKLQSVKGPGDQHTKYTFVKDDIPEPDDKKIEFTTKLTEVGVSLRQYRQSLDEPEITDDNQ